ncbi:MAG: tRNA adenosine(34) deaminase TadA [Woeseiaceae bacterium]
MFMKAALEEAERSAALGEIPVGAVIVRNGTIIGRGHNRSIVDSDPTSHAEIVALRKAAAAEQNYRLSGAEIYVTLEPCAMCVGALLHARISRLVFGAYDSKAGAAGSALDLTAHRSLNHRIEVNGGLLQEECSDILQRFFSARR